MFFEYLYVVKENKRREHRLPSRTLRDRLGAGPLSTITIQDMLKGVNGSQGKLYFQDDGAEVVLV